MSFAFGEQVRVGAWVKRKLAVAEGFEQIHGYVPTSLQMTIGCIMAHGSQCDVVISAFEIEPPRGGRLPALDRGNSQVGSKHAAKKHPWINDAELAAD